jgi:hypothetical protein
MNWFCSAYEAYWLRVAWRNLLHAKNMMQRGIRIALIQDTGT